MGRDKEALRKSTVEYRGERRTPRGESGEDAEDENNTEEIK